MTQDYKWFLKISGKTENPEGYKALRLKATLTTQVSSLQHNTTHTCRNPTYVPGPRDPGIVFFFLDYFDI